MTINDIFFEHWKPAWFVSLLITLPGRHFADVASNLLRRD
jgi:hypothetical protein